MRCVVSLRPRAGRPIIRSSCIWPRGRALSQWAREIPPAAEHARRALLARPADADSQACARRDRRGDRRTGHGRIACALPSGGAGAAAGLRRRYCCTVRQPLRTHQSDHGSACARRARRSRRPDPRRRRLRGRNRIHHRRSVSGAARSAATRPHRARGHRGAARGAPRPQDVQDHPRVRARLRRTMRRACPSCLFPAKRSKRRCANGAHNGLWRSSHASRSLPALLVGHWRLVPSDPLAYARDALRRAARARRFRLRPDHR